MPKYRTSLPPLEVPGIETFEGAVSSTIERINVLTHVFNINIHIVAKIVSG